MRPSSLTQSIGLVLAGFLVGVIVTSMNRNPNTFQPASTDNRQGQDSPEYASSYRTVAQTGVWDVLVDNSGEGRSVARGQNGSLRVIVRDDKSALYVMTYKEGDPVWQGRLMDVGNDGIVEVADLSYGHCEAFTPLTTVP